ncbi:MAG: 50S ribosomal protein L18Ae [Candidatus Thorarchaeota archaeon]|nr:MAG: 50S ribosomal protein L18a [Candidatus Thorarchaeota archaeon]RLI58913.1 MAG: 50S ribosomal protein L18a [Candidatus Thorarchaeota archaeon]
MSMKVWRAEGEYVKRKKVLAFSKELLGESESRVRERLLSELGSRHRVKRKDIQITEIKEIKPEEVRSLELRKILGVESEFA